LTRLGQHQREHGILLLQRLMSSWEPEDKKATAREVSLTQWQGTEEVIE
jgi:hypothetical protein